MKCRRCRAPAVIDVRRHNAGFCADCFTHHCREQVRRAIEDHDMIHESDRVLVAVSGGKDSLGLWQLLRELGYEADGLYVGLGIGDYSDRSGRVRTRVREGARTGRCSRSTCGTPTASTSPTARAPPSGVPCSACGLSKRHVFNDAAISQRLRRPGDRPQPRRRSRGAPRQRVALGRRLPRSPAPGAPGRAGLRAQGEAARPAWANASSPRTAC